VTVEVLDDVKSIRSFADITWKEALKLYFKEFMDLCWQEAYLEIDWNKEPEFLEQELQAIMQLEDGSRVTDRLVKVWHCDGRERFILIHLEVQGQKEEDFSERMMIYRYRIFDRYRTNIASMAILSDNNKNWRPTLYYTEQWGSSLQLSFPILKILDYKAQKQSLLENKNPFALVILAQLGAIETAKNKDKRLDFKIFLTRKLFERGWDKNKILTFYRFLDGLLILPKSLKLLYHQEVVKIEEEKKVSFMTTAESIGHERGLAQGLEQGREQGRVEGEGALLLAQLEYKFKNLPQKYVQLIQAADSDSLLLWGKRLIAASTLEEVFES
jgi:hypothetical protein